jgi:hypothetical protein
MAFDPKTTTLTCNACGFQCNQQEFDSQNVNELDLLHTLKEIEQYNEDDESLSVSCPNCGGQNDFPVNIVATACTYCKSPLTAAQNSKRTLRPQGLVPFAIPKDKAQSTFKTWLKSQWFLPNKAKKLNLRDSLKGVYRPTWTFDFTSQSFYVGERGDYYYVTVKTKNGTRTERKTRWRGASGSVRLDFDDILVYASNRLDRKLQESLGGFMPKQAVDYNNDAIMGFDEESYDVKLTDAFEEAKSFADDRIRSEVRRDIGGDEQRIFTVNTAYSDLSYKLLLIPFWSSTYIFKGKSYTYIVNGQTGNAHGTRPYSAVKITFAIILGIVAALFLYALVEGL